MIWPSDNDREVSVAAGSSGLLRDDRQYRGPCQTIAESVTVPCFPFSQAPLLWLPGRHHSLVNDNHEVTCA